MICHGTIRTRTCSDMAACTIIYCTYLRLERVSSRCSCGTLGKEVSGQEFASKTHALADKHVGVAAYAGKYGRTYVGGEVNVVLHV